MVTDDFFRARLDQTIDPARLALAGSDLPWAHRSGTFGAGLCQ